MRIKLLTLGCLLFGLQFSYAQRTITGTVTDAETNETLIGANIVVTGTSSGTVTDFDGNFSLEVPEDAASLTISYTGYTPQQVSIEGVNSLNVALSSGTVLDEVVVVGYTTQRKADLTGAVTAVDIKEVETLPAGNAMKNLQGRIPGVNITANGNPNSTANVRIRGVGLGRLGFNNPLYVVDGIPTISGMHELNPNDIESLQVLRDAASASIYGSRAANGVIIITTKKGRAGQVRVNLRANVSAENFSYEVNPLNTEQRAAVVWQAAVNDGTNPNNASPLYRYDWNGDFNNPQLNKILLPEFIDGRRTMNPANTDWFDEITQTSVLQDYNLAVSNSSERGQYYLSGGYYNHQGVVKESQFERYTVRLNSDYNIIPGMLKIGENLTLTNQQANQVNDLAEGAIGLSIEQQTIVPIRTADGLGWGGPTGGITDRDNPVRLIEMNKDNTSNFNKVLGNLFVELTPLPGLNLRSSFGVEYNFFYNRNFRKAFTAGSLNFEDRLSTFNNRYGNWVWSNTATYHLNLANRHDFNFLAGTESIKYNAESFEGVAQGFASQDRDFAFLSQGTTGQLVNGGGDSWALQSYFGKVDYVYNNTLLLSGTVRRDGSSRFGSNNRWGVFPAASAGIRISELIDVNAISDLKVRASWGQNGNQEISTLAQYAIFAPRYATTSLFGGANQDNGTAYDINGADQGTLPSGFARIQSANPDLKWETSTQTNFGVDFSLLDYKLYGSVDYFTKETKDILTTTVPLATEGEGAQRIVNGGTVENSGLEFLLGYQGKIGKLRLDISGNLSTAKNEVIALPEEVVNSFPGNGQDKTILGRSVNSVYGFIFDGIFQNQGEVDDHATQSGAAPGRIRYMDLNNDGEINDEDQDFFAIFDNPDFIYGMNFNIAYKGFDLAVFFQGVSGGEIRNGWKLFTDFTSLNVGSNYGGRTLEAWSPQNPNSSIPALTLVDNNNEARESSYYWEPGSYLKLRNLTLGYTPPESLIKRFGMQNARFYVQGQNLLTIKPSETIAQDPEAPSATFPVPQRVTFGLSLTF
ncbi:MAG: TonB-dependent receptor [Phaeodactylibacter sp.]|nr:TonB-dependent receptor [Phaeodactylibacter sp.]